MAIDLQKIGDPVEEQPRDFPPVHDANMDLLMAELASIDTDIGTLQVTDQTHSSAITELSNRVASVQAEVDALDNTYATDVDIIALQVQIDNLQLQLDSLDNDYATDAELQAVSGALQAQINGLGDGYATDAELQAVSGALQSNIDNIIIDAEALALSAGTHTVDTFADIGGDGCEWLASVKSGSNLRTSKIIAVWDGSSSAEYTEFSTSDIGDTTDVVFAVADAGGTVTLSAEISGGSSWDIKTKRLMI